MKTRTFRGFIKDTSHCGEGAEFEFEVPVDATEKEIEEIAKEEAFDNIEWHYNEVF